MAVKRISAIVPVYNSASYINKCIESLLAQRWSDWEAIFVDDGSTDDSYNIICGYAKNDDRISVIRQKNAGAGMARNAGISKAVGDYIVFIDSDDIIKPEYFQELANRNEDVVFIDINRVNEEGKLLTKEYMSRYKSLSKDDFIRYQMTGAIPWGGCRKAVKRNLIESTKIRFSSDKVGEEAIYSFKVMLCAKTYGFIEKPIYQYVQRAQSLSRTKLEDPYAMLADSYIHCADNQHIDDGGGYCDTINAVRITAAAVSIDRIARYSKNYCEFKIKALKRWRKACSEISDRHEIDFRHMSLKSRVVAFLIRKRLFYFTYVISRLKSKIIR